MSKGLTENWKKGKIKGGYYYLLMNDGSIRVSKTVYIVGENRFWWDNASIDFVKEVLAPVPSYDEIKRLQEKLSEAETIFKIIKRNMENPNWHKDRPLTDLEIAIKSQVCGYIERYGVK